uniref:Reverse transcriptase Ty1/copia-type domain-containing protein n=1 Tax=Cajanus cajan TaxID=3821 RepID=A0A151RRT5_CAJCA|nr:hypothetical protein KK1_033206 [Cajanus cajan]
MSSSFIQQFINKLHIHFPLKDMGKLHYFLGIEAKYTSDGSFILSQARYINELLSKINMQNAKSIKTPLAPGTKLQSNSTKPFSDLTRYKSIIGALQYCTIKRSDVAFVVNNLCQFMHKPLESHWKAIKRVLRYLNSTIEHGLDFYPSSNLDINGYYDSDWASNFSDMTSTSGFCLYLGRNLISWMVKKQHVASHSSTEAKFTSMVTLVVEIQWVKIHLYELKVPIHKPPLIWCDNQRVVLLTTNPILHSKSKHFELDL